MGRVIFPAPTGTPPYRRLWVYGLKDRLPLWQASRAHRGVMSMRPVWATAMKNGKLTKSISTTFSLPDRGGVQDRAGNVLQALMTIRERVQQDVEALQDNQQSLETEQKKLAHNQAELAQRRDKCETQQRDVQTRAADLNQQQADVETAFDQLQVNLRKLGADAEQLDAERTRLAEHQEAQARAVATLAEREHALARSEQQMENRTVEQNTRESEFQQQVSEFSAKAKALEADALALATARETVTALQAQLNRDHEEIALQREELLRRLDSAPQVVRTPSNGQSVPAPSTPWQSVPKPASAPKVDRFRKLRRDAKRRAIGV